MQKHIVNRNFKWLYDGVFSILESVYSTLFLDCLKLRNFQVSVRIEATVDANVDMIYQAASALMREMSVVVYTYLREASVVARSTEMGNAKASSSGMSNRYGSHAFVFNIYINNAKEEGLRRTNSLWSHHYTLESGGVGKNYYSHCFLPLLSFRCMDVTLLMNMQVRR